VSVTTIAPALLDGMRAGLLYMLLAAAASAASALLALREGMRDDPPWRALLAVAGCWLAVAALARLGGMLADAAPGLLWIPALAAPPILVAVLALWRFGPSGRTARAFTLAPRAARQLALSPADAARRLLLLQILGAVGGSLLLVGAGIGEITLAVTVAGGIALSLDGRTPELGIAVAFLLSAAATTLAAAFGLGREPVIAAGAALVASLAAGVVRVRSGVLA